jgi:hypothetical protein
MTVHGDRRMKKLFSEIPYIKQTSGSDKRRNGK